MGLKLVRRNKKVEKPPRTGAGPDWAYPMVLSRQVLKKIKNKKQSGSNPKKIKKWNLKGGGDFDIELKIPKEMVNQGVMYGYKKGGQV